jgi:hypothetical protein
MTHVASFKQLFRNSTKHPAPAVTALRSCSAVSRQQNCWQPWIYPFTNEKYYNVWNYSKLGDIMESSIETNLS